MPTYSFSLTLASVRDKIARMLGISEEGQALPPEDVVTINDAISLRLRELHELGILWWRVSGAQTSLAVSAGVATVEISAADYLFPVSLALDVGTEQAPLHLIGHADYQGLPDKATQGQPDRAFISGTTIRLYPTPALSYTAKLTYQAKSADLVAGSPVDAPIEMVRPLAALVAADLAEEFDGLDAGKVNRLLAGAGPAMATIRALNVQRTDSATITAEYF